VYDLEDSVAAGRKAEARVALRKFLETTRPADVGEVAVRINSVDTKYALDDLTEVVSIHRLRSPHLKSEAS